MNKKRQRSFSLAVSSTQMKKNPSFLSVFFLFSSIRLSLCLRVFRGRCWAFVVLVLLRGLNCKQTADTRNVLVNSLPFYGVSCRFKSKMFFHSKRKTNSVDCLFQLLLDTGKQNENALGRFPTVTGDCSCASVLIIYTQALFCHSTCVPHEFLTPTTFSDVCSQPTMMTTKTRKT